MRRLALICAALIGQFFFSQASAETTLDEAVLAAEQDLVCAIAIELVLADQTSKTGNPAPSAMQRVALLMRLNAHKRLRELPQGQTNAAHEKLEALRQDLLMTVAELATSEDPIAVFQKQLENKVSNCSGLQR